MKQNNRFFLILIILSLFTSCSYKSNYNLYDYDNITVSEISGGYSIIPNCYEMNEGLIFYPGGLVEANAYIPLLTKISSEYQIAIFIKKMPLNLAILNSNGCEDILDEYQYISKWYIAGHSLGGVIAASYIYENPEIFKKLILLASYPMNKKPIHNLDIKVLSIIGSNDGLIKMDKITQNKSQLPQDTIFQIIVGGNHAQFGSYGIQSKDGIAKISETEQQILTAQAISSFLRGNDK